IKHISTGQINNGAYFCAALYREEDKIADVCSLSTAHIWSASYDTLYNQAMYYYTSGQKIRVYYVGIGPFYPEFAEFYGDRILTGFSTCDAGFCYGPNKS
ncbi:TPA: subtilase cytotoxin subunit B, partial [Escherichia coli]|nr:subtilase cytotoxin subunit B [Escherichia coli]